MQITSLQIQSIIYNNPKSDLLRSFESFAQAIKTSTKNRGTLHQYVVHYGDSSNEATFTTEEVHMLTEKYHDDFSFKYTFFGFNSGTAKGHNLLASESDTDYILLMNPDIVVSPHFFIHMAQPFADPTVGMVEARQTPLEHPKAFDQVTGEVPWISGACGIIRADVFRAVGGYDADSFFLYCDDVDLSWRVRLAGYRLVYQPAAIAFHAKYINVKGGMVATPAQLYYTAESALFMAHKYSNPKRVKQLLKVFSTSEEPQQKKAVATFLKRKEQHKLPTPIDPKHKVATFVGENYSKHRFVM